MKPGINHLLDTVHFSPSYHQGPQLPFKNNVMKTIIIATDFSLSALHAANYAADMAANIHADILLLHIYQVPISYSEIPMPMDVEDIMENVEKNLFELKGQLIRRTAGKVKIETDVRMGVFFYQELRLACDAIKPYAVVMGSQGTTKSERLFFGGHTVHAMKHLKWPLITVPPEADFSSIKRIGLACDFDKVLDTAPVDEIKMLVSDFNAELHILNTSKRKECSSEIVYESALLNEMLLDLNPYYHFITNANADEAILQFAKTNDLDLLIVLPKKYPLPQSLVHKSHTKQFVLHSPVPVMALHNETT
jgi:nucleotide-binding universal stress UspA family protein